MNPVRAWFSLVLVTLSMTFFHFHRLAPSFIARPLAAEFGVSAAAIGVLASAFFVTYGILQLPAGRIADRARSVPVTVLGLVAVASTTLLSAWATSFSAMLVLRILAGAAASAFFVATVKRVSEAFPASQFTAVHGATFTIRHLAGLAIVYPMALLASEAGWRALYLAGGLAALLMTALLVLVDRDEFRPQRRRSAADPGPALAAGLTNPDDVPVAVALRRIFGLRQTWPPFFAYLGLYTPHLAFSGLWGIDWLISVHGASEGAAATILLLFSAGAVIMPPAAAWLEVRIGSRTRMLGLSALVTAGAWAALAALNGLKPPLIVVALLVVLIGTSSFAFVVTYAVVKELHPPSLLGLATGIQNMAGFLGGMLWQPIAGWILDQYTVAAASAGGSAVAPAGYTVVLWLSAALAATGWLGALAMRESTAARHQAA